MKNFLTKHLVYLTATLALILWASSFPGIKICLEGGYTPFELAVSRFVVASLTLLCFFPFYKIRLPHKKDLFLIFSLSFFGVAAYHAILNYGELHSNASTAAFFTNVAPIFTIIISGILLKERVYLRGWLAIIISFLGVGLINFSNNEGNLRFDLGSIVLLGAAFCWSLFFILQKPLLKIYKPFEVICYSVWGGTLMLVILLPGHISFQSKDLFPTFSMIYLGIGPTAVAYLSWSHVLSRIPVHKASILTYLVPVISTLISYLWLNETPTLLFLVGAAVILGGVILSKLFKTS